MAGRDGSVLDLSFQSSDSSYESPGVDVMARYHHLYDTQQSHHVDGAPKLVKRNKLLDVESRVEEHTAMLMTPAQRTRRLIGNSLSASLTVEISALQASLAEHPHDPEAVRMIESRMVELKDLRRKAVLAAPAAAVPEAKHSSSKMPILA